jgi:nucleotide-binding universal stress UspA family protein
LAWRDFRLPFPYSKILCPVDFDPNSADALAHAAALAMNSGATLYLMHVVQINPLTAQGAAEGFAAKDLYEAQVEHARTRLEQYAQNIPAALTRELVVEIGEPGNLIIAAQQRLGADLVVMGTHGRRGLRHLVLGSIAERIVRESSVPVLTVRAAAA